MESILYKRDAKGDIIRWHIFPTEDRGFMGIAYGKLGHKPHMEKIPYTLVNGKDIESRIAAKRKEGYKAIEDLWDNTPRTFDTGEDLYAYLNDYLPKYNTTSEGFVLPMLAKTLEDNKPFEKCGFMPAQYKINGLRCIIGAEKIEGDLFNNHRFTYTSREGTKWNLSWMDDILVKYISPNLIDMMLEENVCLDGELYLPGYSVNDINSFVKNNTLPQHYQLQYWCYDLAVDNMNARYRYELLSNNVSCKETSFEYKEEHLNNKEQFILLPSFDTNTISSAITLRDEFIHLGFEGLIIRNPYAEYAFGKRNGSMYKFKKKFDGMFRILDIKEDKRGLPIFVLKNDINDELFECTLNTSQEHQKLILEHKFDNIGKTGLVEYRERSGVKQVPFHAKLIKIYV